MFWNVTDLVRAAGRLIRAATEWAARRIRDLFRSHLDKVTNNPAYAAAAGAVIGGLLGFVPIREVLAAVFTAVLGVYIMGVRATSLTPTSRDAWEF